MEAAGVDELPVYAAICGDVYAGCAAADEPVLINIFYTAAITVGWICGCDPGLALIMCEDTILFAGGIVCKVSSNNDQVVFALCGH